MQRAPIIATYAPTPGSRSTSWPAINTSTTWRDVSKTYPGGKKCFENIHLNFLPGVKIGVVGVNGAGKSTLLKIMAGMDTDFKGEAWAAKGAKVGYLAQEPLP